MAEANTTLAEAFRDAGYDTIAALTNPHHHPTSGFDQGFETAQFIVPEDHEDGDGLGNALNRWFLGLLPDRDPDRPLFAYLHYMEVHNPDRPPPHVAREFVRTAGNDRYVNGIPKPGREPSAGDLTFMQELYDGEIRFADELIAEILDGLEAARPGRARIVVVASDHGDEFLDHGGLGHGVTLEPEMLHMPLVLHAPEQCRAQRSDRLVRNLDVGPTLLALAGAPIPEVFEGRNLAPFVCGEVEDSRPPARRRDFSYALTGQMRSLTTPQWHFIWDLSRNEHRLYDRRADPAGLRDVAPEQPTLVKQFRTRLFAFEQGRKRSRAESRRIAAEEIGDAKLDPETAERLRRLGYLDEGD